MKQTRKPATQTYCGFHRDGHGLTLLGRVVLDAWVFGLLPDDQDATGWDLGRMQLLTDQVQAQWDAHGGLPSLLPPPLRQRHAERYAWATERARTLAWNAELREED
jgi:hypothetical protein